MQFSGGAFSIQEGAAGGSSLLSRFAIQPANSAASPLWAIDADFDTGLLHPAANTLAVSTGGVEAMRLSSAQALSWGGGTEIANSTIVARENRANTFTAAPQAIVKGSATGQAPHTSYNTLVIDSTDPVVGMSFLTGNAGSVGIVFGDTDSNIAGALYYLHATDRFMFRSATNNRIWINATNTAANPILQLNGTGAGLFSPAADTLAVSTGGVERLRITSTGHTRPGLTFAYDLGLDGTIWRSLYAAELRVQTLIAQDTIATIGGRILVGPTTKLTADISAGATSISVEHNQMVSGDRVYLQTAPGGIQQVEYMAITSGPSGTGPYTYSVTRNLDGTGANAWKAGDAVFNTGTTGSGFIDLYSIRGTKAATEKGPSIVGNVRTGTGFNSWEPRWAVGNLNGIFGYSSDIYGAAFGTPSGAWLKIDPTNGIRIGHNTTTKIHLNASGDASFVGAITAASGAIGGFSIGASNLFAGAGSTRVELSSSTGIHLGATAFASAPFSVTPAGALKATSGTIGGFSLGATNLFAGSGSSRVELSTSTGIHLGATAFASAPFRVSPAGVLVATNAVIEGTITAGNARLVTDELQLNNGGWLSGVRAVGSGAQFYNGAISINMEHFTSIPGSLVFAVWTEANFQAKHLNAQGTGASYHVNGVKVLSTRRADIGDASGTLANATEKINAILGALRGHGIIGEGGVSDG
jgi:hypothetical protein